MSLSFWIGFTMGTAFAFCLIVGIFLLFVFRNWR